MFIGRTLALSLRSSPPPSTMSSQKKAAKVEKKGEPPPVDPPQDGTAPPPKFCSWHLLALLPIVVAFVIYHIPTIYEEYMARTG